MGLNFCFSSMVNTLGNLNSPKMQISKEEYETFQKEFIFDQLKGKRFGKAFCEKFHINDVVIKCLIDEDLARRFIEEQYINEAEIH